MVVLVFGACAAWVALRPGSRAARRTLAAAVVAYWLAASPVGALTLAGIVGYGYGPLPNAAAAGGADTVVVLSGGELSYTVGGAVLPLLSQESAMRALEAARVYRMIGRGTIVTTGARVYPAIQLVDEAEVLRQALIHVGVPASDILMEAQSHTTREQAVYVSEMLQARGITKFVLVTSKTHMRRSLAAFRALGLDPVPSASPLRSEQLPPPRWLLPTAESLALTDMAVYDLAANVYYWWKGWV